MQQVLFRHGHGGPQRGVRLNRRGPGRFRNGRRVFVRRPLDGSASAEIKFKLGSTSQIFNPTFGVCVEPHGAPRDKLLGCSPRR